MNRKLFFRDDGSFKILQLTDIHYENDDEKDRRAAALMRELIRAENPDFIMTTGDTVCNERNQELIGKGLAPLVESGIPWGYVFGNHDVEFGWSKEGLFEAVTSMPGCVSWHDEASGDGLGNHYLEVRDHAGNPQWLIFGIDSGDYSVLSGIEGYAYVTRRQIDWYRGVIATYESQGAERAGACGVTAGRETGPDRTADFSALVFQHIALPEHEQVWLYEDCYGMHREDCCPPAINSGFFCAMLEAGHTKGVFVGHDHVNDYYGYLHGIALGFGRFTGFNSYGAVDYPRGGRVFVLHEGNTESFETYVRLEGGLVIDEPWVHHPVFKRS